MVANPLDAVPPHSIEAEMSLLGSLILCGTENVHMVADIERVLKGPEDFFFPKHVAIYEAIVWLYQERNAVDAVQLTQRLRDLEQLDEVGGVDYLVELAESVPHSVNGPHYAGIVRDKAKLRRLLHASHEAIKSCHGSDAEPAAVADFLEARAADERAATKISQYVLIGDEMAACVDDLMRREWGQTTAIRTGIARLDQVLAGGVNPGELIIVGARPSAGKSAFAQAMAMSMASDGVPVGFFSQEMGRRQLAERALSAEAGVNLYLIRSNRLGPEQKDRLREAADRWRTGPLVIDDLSALTPALLRSRARRMQQEHGIRALFLDYIQIMRGTSPKASIYERTTECSAALKSIAGELGIPVVALSQLSRSPGDGPNNPPTLDRLKESGALEQDADVVILLHRADYYDKLVRPGEADVIVAKQRNGPTETVVLRWDASTLSLRDVEPLPDFITNPEPSRPPQKQPPLFNKVGIPDA